MSKLVSKLNLRQQNSFYFRSLSLSRQKNKCQQKQKNSEKICKFDLWKRYVKYLSIYLRSWLHFSWMFSSIFRRNFCTQILGMDLNAVTKTLEKFAPTSYAGSWDNVGLLIEPSGPKVVKKVMLTNDLTEPVMQECLNAQVDMIISYHPPIFRPLKRITSKSWKVKKKNPNFFKNFFF